MHLLRSAELTGDRYRQGAMGSTALNDAIGTTVTRVDGSKRAKGRRVLAVIMTDGQTTKSVKHTYARVARVSALYGGGAFEAAWVSALAGDDITQ